MAKQIEFKQVAAPPEEALRLKVETAPFEHGEALLKAYALLETANKHGILDLLRGAISAEDTILNKVAGYANTPEGINTMRNLLVLGKSLGTLNPDFLREASQDLAASVQDECKKQPAGLFATTRRMFSGDALRGLYILIAGLEALGRTARKREKL
ncbi:hypothetical protein ACPOL_0215 [Acidisarcina polymorpha]|uniref:DUF1641 domain-containing protein n=1 Tax=Acidisarcina polymorpha TaxID=2211140 RepID=A0A2Z5FS65_9BACT|nr:DUF1641 domain-containing protein [Acidisarcina polymorpha]AXC09600.1 hypothetical protein ACPOL_0215 [Acidisarcina polymorpha]